MLALGAVACCAGCGAHAVGTSPPPLRALTSPTAAPPPPLVAVLDQPFGATPNTLRLVTESGRVVASAPLRADAEALTVAGSRVLIAGGGRMQAMDRGGVLIDLGPLPGNAADELVRGLVASPDGSAWMWASVSQLGGGLVRSRIYVQRGDAAAPQLLHDGIESGHALQPVAWAQGGVVVGDEPLGIGGYVLFRRSFGDTSVIDPSTGTLTPLSSQACAFSDLSRDGTLACVRDGREAAHGPGPVTLHVAGPHVAAFDVPLPATVTQAGAALFRDDDLVLSLASAAVTTSAPQRVDDGVVSLAGHALHSFGPGGIVPVGWLPDGSLLGYRSPGMDGGAPGTWLVSRDGAAASLLSSSPAVIGAVT